MSVNFSEAPYISEVITVIKYVQDQCLHEEMYPPNTDDFKHR